MFTSQLDKTSIERLVRNVEFLMTRNQITTSQQLAEASGLSTNSINRLRRGEMDAPTVNTLRALADVFDLYWPLLLDVDVSKASDDDLRPTVYTTLVAEMNFPKLVEKTKILARKLEENMLAAIQVAQGDDVPLDKMVRNAAQVSAALAILSDIPRDRPDRDQLTITLLGSIK